MILATQKHLNTMATLADSKPTQHCSWRAQSPSLRHYHDHEWGFPTTNSQLLFEKLSLESLQSGLSWQIILNKRPAIRACFKQFDYHKIALFSQQKVEALLNEKKIIRNRKKIEAIIHNAQIAINIEKTHGSLAKYVWQFQPSKINEPHQNPPEEVNFFVKSLKALDWRFIGPTTAYAFMQAAGLVNDHDLNCPTRAVVCQQST